MLIAPRLAGTPGSLGVVGDSSHGLTVWRSPVPSAFIRVIRGELFFPAGRGMAPLSREGQGQYGPASGLKTHSASHRDGGAFTKTASRRYTGASVEGSTVGNSWARRAAWAALG